VKSATKSSLSSSSKRASGAAADYTIIITASLIPSHPCIYFINQTIHSVYEHIIKGLDVKSTPMIIAIDGIHRRDKSDENKKRCDEMVQNLQGNFSNATILTRDASVGLKPTLQHALATVKTKTFTFCSMICRSLRISIILRSSRLWNSTLLSWKLCDSTYE
jgi:hypothetical protein